MSEAEPIAAGFDCALLDLGLPDASGLEPSRDTVTLRCAGHPSPLLIPATGEARPLVEGPGGPPLGVVEDATWVPAEIDIEAGTSLLLHTDGLVEGLRGDSERPGQDGLAALAAPSRLTEGDTGAAVRALVARVTDLNGGPLRDDVALVLIGT